MTDERVRELAGRLAGNGSLREHHVRGAEAIDRHVRALLAEHEAERHAAPTATGHKPGCDALLPPLRIKDEPIVRDCTCAASPPADSAIEVLRALEEAATRARGVLGPGPICRALDSALQRTAILLAREDAKVKP